jgi:hypothetical protein
MIINWAEHVALVRVKGNACRGLVGNCDGKRPLGGSRHAWDMTLKWILNK